MNIPLVFCTSHSFVHKLTQLGYIEPENAIKLKYFLQCIHSCRSAALHFIYFVCFPHTATCMINTSCSSCRKILKTPIYVANVGDGKQGGFCQHQLFLRRRDLYVFSELSSQFATSNPSDDTLVVDFLLQRYFGFLWCSTEFQIYTQSILLPIFSIASMAKIGKSQSHFIAFLRVLWVCIYPSFLFGAALIYI